MPNKSRITRRAALGLIGGGAVLASMETLGFTNVTGDRSVNVSTADDPDALIGLLIADQVKRRNRELLADVTNNTDTDLSITFSLDDPTQGTLYGPDGGSGNSVTFSLVAGNTKPVDIEAAVGGEIISFTITTTGDVGFEATRETEAVSGKVERAVEIERLIGFESRLNTNTWTINQRVKVTSTIDSNTLDRVEYEVTDGSGDVVGSLTHDTSGDVYEKEGNPNSPAITIEPDSGYTLQQGETYELTVTGWDNEGNFAVETRAATA